MKSEEKNNEKCGPTLYIDSECLGHMIENQTEYVTLKKDNKWNEMFERKGSLKLDDLTNIA